MTERLTLLSTIEPYIGKYYSQDYVRRKILRQTDSEITEIDKRIKKEIKDGIIPDPSAVDPITGEPLPPEEGSPDAMSMGGMEDMGEVPQEPDLEQESQKAQAKMDKDFKKAEI
jgi:hypothetical protein